MKQIPKHRRTLPAIFLCLFIICFAFGGEAQESAPVKLELTGIDPALARKIESYVQEKMIELHAPGGAVAIVKGDKRIFAGYFGWGDIENKKPINSSTIFRIGSISKSMTAIGLMQLWEKGEFKLDDDVNDYFPRPLIFPPNPEEKPVTFRHLLTHTSGGGDLLSYKQLFMKGFGIVIKGETPEPLEQYIRVGMKTRLEPGDKYIYCNYGYLFLGIAMEEITGEPFYLYMKENVFEPLGMNDTAFWRNDDIRKNIAEGYTYKKGAFEVDPHKTSVMVPSGNVYANLDDMSRYIIALLNGAKNEYGQVLKPETLDMMMQTQYGLDKRQEGYGFGFDTHENLWGYRIVGHGGHVPFGFSSQLLLVPDQKLGVIMLTNSETRAPYEIVWGILKIMLNVEDKQQPVELPSNAVWSELIGFYGPEHSAIRANWRLLYYGIGTYRVDVLDGNLVLIYTWQGKKKARRLLQVNADDPYFYRIEDNKSEIPQFVAFRRGNNGKMYIIPGGLKEFIKLGAARRCRARISSVPGRLITK